MTQLLDVILASCVFLNHESINPWQFPYNNDTLLNVLADN